MVPAGTPDPMTGMLLSRAIGKVLSSPDVKKRLSKIGFDPMPGTAEAFARYVGAEWAEWGRGDSTGEHQDRLTLSAAPSEKGGRRNFIHTGRREAERAAKTDSGDRLCVLAIEASQRCGARPIHDVGGSPQDLAALTRRTGIYERSARDFFDALVALGALQRDAEGQYKDDPEFDLYLDRRKPTYLGGLLEHLNVQHCRNWGLLTQALRTGAPPSDGVGDLQGAP